MAFHTCLSFCKDVPFFFFFGFASLNKMLIMTGDWNFWVDAACVDRSFTKRIQKQNFLACSSIFSFLGPLNSISLD